MSKIRLYIKIMMLILVLTFTFSAMPVFAQPDSFTAFLISAKSREEITQIVKSGVFESASNVKTLYPNKTVSVVFGVNNPMINAGNAVKVAFDIKLLKPDQTIMFDGPSFTTAHAVVNNHSLGDDVFDMTLEDSDPEGEYTFVVVAKDLVSGKEAKIQQVLMYKKAGKETQGISSMNDLGFFMTFYYQKKDASFVIPALEYLLGQDDLLKDGTHLKPAQHFFATIGHNDPALLKQMEMLQGKYSGQAATILSEIIQEATAFISPEPRTAKDLDYLWSEFMATGDDAPVKKIISTLSSGASGEMLITAGAAEWSLGANGVEHEKVYEVIKAESIIANGSAKEKLSQLVQKIEAQKMR